MIFYLNDRLRDKPYWQTILYAALLFGIMITIITSLVGLLIIRIETGLSPGDPGMGMEFRKFIADPVQLKNILVWSIVIGLTQLTMQINDKFGQGVFWNIIKGIYRFPRQEERIFMMIDLYSSTSIAEKLGNERYHMLLKDFYADITNPIIYNKGEIYQYVGDEAVITWKLDTGIANNHCLRCYFDIRQTMRDLKEKYQTKYGLVPDFKAGFHCGTVIAGEIGIIKRDITFSGDVLNTTSRIQSMCNEHHVKPLCSDELLQQMKFQDQFSRIPIGDIALRGKAGKVAVSTLEMRPSSG
jgi:adenylate cyclase